MNLTVLKWQHHGGSHPAPCRGTTTATATAARPQVLAVSTMRTVFPSMTAGHRTRELTVLTDCQIIVGISRHPPMRPPLRHLHILGEVRGHQIRMPTCTGMPIRAVRIGKAKHLVAQPASTRAAAKREAGHIGTLRPSMHHVRRRSGTNLALMTAADPLQCR